MDVMRALTCESVQSLSRSLVSIYLDYSVFIHFTAKKSTIQRGGSYMCTVFPVCVQSGPCPSSVSVYVLPVLRSQMPSDFLQPAEKIINFNIFYKD
jgi:hypothetical protein